MEASRSATAAATSPRLRSFAATEVIANDQGNLTTSSCVHRSFDPSASYLISQARCNFWTSTDLHRRLAPLLPSLLSRAPWWRKVAQPWNQVRHHQLGDASMGFLMGRIEQPQGNHVTPHHAEVFHGRDQDLHPKSGHRHGVVGSRGPRLPMLCQNSPPFPLAAKADDKVEDMAKHLALLSLLDHKQPLLLALNHSSLGGGPGLPCH